MLLKTRWVIAVALLATALQLTSNAYPAGSDKDRHSSEAVGRAGDPGTRKRIESLLPRAWDEARRQIRERYSSRCQGIDQLERPDIKFRNGEWYDDKLHEYVVGDTDLRDDPPIQVGLVGDAAFDYETTVHEFKHYVVDRLKLGESAHRWIDGSDSQDLHSSVHVKKSR